MEAPSLTTVVFILGGPGAGKGTQSERIVKEFNFTHLSAGDLLREQRKTPGSQYGQIIQKHIVQGKIVPSEITVGLLENAIKNKALENGRFLVDGFPRNIQNLNKWEELLSDKVNVPICLHLVCTEEKLKERLLKRGETSGRTDDNIQSILKRFKTYQSETLDVIKHYESQKKNYDVDAEGTPEAVFQEITKIFKQHGLV